MKEKKRFTLDQVGYLVRIFKPLPVNWRTCWVSAPFEISEWPVEGNPPDSYTWTAAGGLAHGYRFRGRGQCAP
jgi:hypothetical protein